MGAVAAGAGAAALRAGLAFEERERAVDEVVGVMVLYATQPKARIYNLSQPLSPLSVTPDTPCDGVARRPDPFRHPTGPYRFATLT